MDTLTPTQAQPITPITRVCPLCRHPHPSLTCKQYKALTKPKSPIPTPRLQRLVLKGLMRKAGLVEF